MAVTDLPPWSDVETKLAAINDAGLDRETSDWVLANAILGLREELEDTGKLANELLDL